MKNIFTRLEKKLIIKNNLFIKKGAARLPENTSRVKLHFKGDNALAEFTNSADAVFSGFNPAHSVLVKINLNSANPYPASTSFEMLDVLIRSLIEFGVKNICIGDCSGIMHLPTRKIVSKKKLSYFKKYGAKIKVFDYGRWADVPINGVYFKNIILSGAIYHYDKIINLANLKSHCRSGFSFSTKSLVGFMHPAQRFILHRDHLEERIAEVSLAIKPDISIIDARSIFIDGGPDTGKVAEAKTIIVDNDLLEADLFAYNLLFYLKAQNKIKDISENPYDNTFFKHFLSINKNTL